MAGQYRIVLDPTGYSTPVEPGLDVQWNGARLAGRMGKDKTGAARPFIDAKEKLWSPPGSQWLLPSLRQWEPYWWVKAESADQYLDHTKWVFASGINPATDVDEVDFMKVDAAPAASATPGVVNLSGGGGPGSKAMQFLVPAVPGAQPMAVNWTTFFAAANTDLITGFQCLARTGASFNGWKTPYLRLLLNPSPDDVVVFGFGDMALYLSSAYCIVLRSPANDGQTWELLAAFQRGQDRNDITKVPVGQQHFRGTPRQGSAYIQDDTFLVVPVGFEDLAVGIGTNSIQLVKTRRLTDGTIPSFATQVKPGPWWFASKPGTFIRLHAEIVRYATAEHAPTTGAAPPLWFDFSSEYTPTVAPQLWDHHVIYSIGALATVALTSGYRLTGGTLGDAIEVQVLNESGAAWASDGTHSSGTIRFKLTPGNDPDGTPGGTACIAPQIRLFQLRFPPKLAARANTAQILDDTHFTSVRVQTSLREPLGKRFHIFLTDPGLSLLEGLGFLGRSDFPVHFEEQVSPGVWAIRIAAWCESMGFEEVSLTGYNPSTHKWNQPIRAYEIVCRGLLQRVQNANWLLSDVLVDPVNNGSMEHTTVAQRVFSQAGFDVTDPTQVSIETDTAAPLIRVLPGSPGTDPGGDGTERMTRWAPQDDENPVDYLHRIAKDWRGWLVFEGLGPTLYYWHDPIDDALNGISLPSSPGNISPLYPSAAWAKSAGAVGNKYTSPVNVAYEPVGSNFVRIIGTDSDGNGFQVVDCDQRSISDPTAFNYIGEKVRPTKVRKDAPTLSAAKQMARILINFLRVKRTHLKVPITRAPWTVLPNGLDVSGFIDLFTQPGLDRLLVSGVDSTLIGPGIWQTVYHTETLPPGG